MDKPAVSAGGMLVFTPLSSVNSADLLFQMAGKYTDFYTSSIDMPLHLAQQIEGSVSLGSADSTPGDLTALQARMAALELHNTRDMAALRNDVAVLRAENARLGNELGAKIVALEAENVALRNEVAGLRAENALLGIELGGAKRKLRLLSAMEAVLVRKLIEQCRNKCKEALRGANIPFPAEDWNSVIDDAGCLSWLTLLGLRRDYGLKATRYGSGARMQQKGDTAAHVISEDKSLYAEVICSRKGFERESLVEIYKFVFDKSDPEQDCFDRAEASTPRT